MRDAAERAYFALCLTLGRLLRSARYSSARTVREHGELRVRKRRALHAPLLVWLAAIGIAAIVFSLARLFVPGGGPAGMDDEDGLPAG